MAKVVGTLLVLLAGLGLSTVQAGFRSPESLVRNVYAYYGNRSSELSSGLPRDPATARQFFDQSLRGAWSSLKDQPYDFLVQSPTWKLRAVTLNFIVVNGPDGWVISDVESPHDSLRMFLVQYRN